MEADMDLKQTVFSLKSHYSKIWESTSITLSTSQDKYTVDTQRSKEIAMDRFADEAILLIKGFKARQPDEAILWGSRLKSLIYNCGVDILGLEGISMRFLLEDGFCDVTSDFTEKSREFDAGFKIDDIFQSLRNAWIMCCIQKLMGLKVEVTPSVFAYSMLYPYSDNYLDHSPASAAEKKDLNHKFRKRLAGENLIGESVLEMRLFRLVGIIEEQYPRERFPMVYESLLGIQTAQEKSIGQAGGEKGSSAKLSGSDIMDISIEKGGCSVLADGCLVKGTLSMEESSFLFGFGVLLQFLDDLQDAKEDKKDGHMSVFSQPDTYASLEINTNKLINFTMSILDEDKCFVSPEAAAIKRLMKKSILFLMMGAIACNADMYAASYLKQLEEYSPMSFKYLRGFYRKMAREFDKLKIKFAIMPLEVPMAKAFASGVLE